MLRRSIFALAALALAAGPAAAEGPVHVPDYDFSFEGPFGTYDMASVQRGFAVYKQVCSSCHAMDHLSYRHLGQDGGPFAAYWVRDHDTGALVIRDAPGPPAHGGRLAAVTDNPFVAAIADDVMIADIDPDTGQPIERAGRPSDTFRAPFPNEAAARYANGGAFPPDLWVITLARHGGADYIRGLLTGYTGETRDGRYVNHNFAGELIAMAPPLIEGVVTYDDGTEATVDQMATDVSTFLAWAGDPHMQARKALGLQVLIFLAILAGLLYLAYKQVWRGQKH